MSTRLFFAIFPDSATREALCHAQDHIACKANKVAPENLHLTLAFIGNCEEQQIPCIQDAALEVSERSFQMHLKRYRMMSRHYILAAAPLKDPPALMALQKSLLRSLKKCDIHLNSKRFMPHISLFRKVKGLPMLHKMEPPIAWRVESFSLVASTLKPDRAHYQILKTYDLKTTPKR